MGIDDSQLWKTAEQFKSPDNSSCDEKEWTFNSTEDAEKNEQENKSEKCNPPDTLLNKEVATLLSCGMKEKTISSEGETLNTENFQVKVNTNSDHVESTYDSTFDQSPTSHTSTESLQTPNSMIVADNNSETHLKQENESDPCEKSSENSDPTSFDHSDMNNHSDFKTSEENSDLHETSGDGIESTVSIDGNIVETLEFPEKRNLSDRQGNGKA